MQNLKVSEQQVLFNDYKKRLINSRSGTFIDNMKLPVHRWFRFSAGFSAEWVKKVIIEEKTNNPNLTVLDPFVGSGTTCLAADALKCKSYGIEAHPFIAEIAKTKLKWDISPQDFYKKAYRILNIAKSLSINGQQYPQLLLKCYSQSHLYQLEALKSSWLSENDKTPALKLVWLAINSILRSTSFVGTAQWQYVLPKKKKKIVIEPFIAFQNQCEIMRNDMIFYQEKYTSSFAEIFQSDARKFPEVISNKIDLVITSPPYANNYDYADATRLEMTFWGDVETWGDLHDAVRKYLMRSSSQHASKEKLSLEKLIEDKNLFPIKNELTDVCYKLKEERLLHGGKKHYHTMVAAYFLDMTKIWNELRRVCKTDSKVCFVVGDSAPYGIYVPVDKWIGEIAIASGFSSFKFVKLRDRNIKWKNRKHNVPLHEGRLWVIS